MALAGPALARLTLARPALTRLALARLAFAGLAFAGLALAGFALPGLAALALVPEIDITACPFVAFSGPGNRTVAPRLAFRSAHFESRSFPWRS